jgi:hypothetical protein
MPDLRQALAVLHQMRPPSPESPTWGTDWGRGNISTAKRVPVVPDDPAPNEAALGSRKTVCPRDVLERAAILEFCEGLARKEADVQALAEFGCTSWEASLLLRAEAAD